MVFNSLLLLLLFNISKATPCLFLKLSTQDFKASNLGQFFKVKLCMSFKIIILLCCVINSFCKMFLFPFIATNFDAIDLASELNLLWHG